MSDKIRELFLVFKKTILEKFGFTPGEITAIEVTLEQLLLHKHIIRLVDTALGWYGTHCGYKKCYEAQVIWLVLLKKYANIDTNSIAVYAQRLFCSYEEDDSSVHTPKTDKLLRYIINGQNNTNAN